MHYALRLLQKADSIDNLKLSLEQCNPVQPLSGHALIQVKAAAINPSDVKASLGLMPQAKFPRTPGRDFAGIVIEGPSDWIGKEVYGSGGDIGITRDGSHASYITLPVSALQQRPMTMSIEEAGAVGVPFVTAYEGYRRSGFPQSGMTVAVMGANGKVGQAAVQIAAMNGAQVIAVQRSDDFNAYACSPVKVICSKNLSSHEIAQQIRDYSQQKGADLIYNTVGSPYFETANKALAKGGAQIFIATQDKAVYFDIFAFYRGMHTYVGIDSLALDCTMSNCYLDALRPGFESGRLKPYPIDEVFTLDNALEAYRLVLSGSSKRVIFKLP
jgi:NADPH:quinone reductase-like Zn-dependent oxidoreductase